MSYSADARQIAVNIYNNTEMSVKEAADALGISPTTLQEWRGRVKASESLEDRHRPGRPPKLKPEHIKRLIELTQLYPDWTQQKFADALNEEFEELCVDQPMISMTFKRQNISLKKTVGGRREKHGASEAADG
jgi:transposase